MGKRAGKKEMGWDGMGWDGMRRGGGVSGLDVVTVVTGVWSSGRSGINDRVFFFYGGEGVAVGRERREVRGGQ